MVASRSDRYAEALWHALAEATPREQVEGIDRFVALLLAEHALALGPSIVAALERKLGEWSQRTVAHLTVARPHSEATLKQFMEFGEVATTVDPALVGGFRLQRYDSIIDGSVQGALQHIQQALWSA